MAKVLVLAGNLTFGLSEWLGCKMVTEEDITGNRNFKVITEPDKAKIAFAVRENNFDLIIIRTAKDDEGAGLEKVRVIKAVKDDLCQQIIIVSVSISKIRTENYRALGVTRFTTIYKIIECVEQVLSLNKAA